MSFTDSVAVRILSEDIILAGVGNELREYSRKKGYTVLFTTRGKLRGIERNALSDRIVAYSEGEFLLIDFNSNRFELLYRGYLSDWISSAKVLLDNDTFTLVTAHSVAILATYSRVKGVEIQEKSSCSDKSTLYCSTVYGDTWNSLLVFGGNAFGEVLIWQPSIRSVENEGKAELLHRIVGHFGVIFSIDVDLESKLMVTTSDDRSVQFWDIHSSPDSSGLTDCKNNQFVPRRKGYGHLARVFKGLIIRDNNKTYVISGGEDSFVCLWDENCQLIFKRRQQFGAIIWNLDYHSPTKTLFTSGSSGNILAYNLKEHFTKSRPISSTLSNQGLEPLESIAKIKFFAETYVVAVTNKNRLMYKNSLPNGIWQTIGDTVPYKCTALEVWNDYIAVAGFQHVTIYHFLIETSSFDVVCDEKILPGIIRSLLILSDREFLAADKLGNCKVFNINNPSRFREIHLPQCKERWVTAAAEIKGEYFLMSTRQGALLLFRQTEDEISFCHALPRLHGHLGCTLIKIIGNNKNHSILKTFGHDGSVRTIRINKATETLSITSRENVPITWVERSFISRKQGESSEDELLFGFNDDHFVLWSRNFDVQFQINCGGGHRSWDLNLQLDENRVLVVLIERKQVLLYKESIYNVSQLKIRAVRNKWHVRPCNVLCSFQWQHKLFVASGGEDNLLKVSHYSHATETLDQIVEIHSHISNIRNICLFDEGSGNYLIISSGGRAQICVSSFNANAHTYEELANYTLQSKSAALNDIRFDPETRVMSLDVRKGSLSHEIYVGCSDGYLRKLSMSTTHTFSLVSEVYYGRCILHVRVVGNYLITGATDGVLRFWDFDLNDVFEIKHHASGINSFDVRIVNENEFHLLTGGDDQQVVYSKVSQIAEDNLEMVTVTKMDRFHTAQVTGVRLSPCLKYFLSTGVDQILNVVHLHDFSTKSTTLIGVADVKGIDISWGSSRSTVLVYGCGLRVIEFPS